MRAARDLPDVRGRRLLPRDMLHSDGLQHEHLSGQLRPLLLRCGTSGGELRHGCVQRRSAVLHGLLRFGGDVRVELRTRGRILHGPRPQLLLRADLHVGLPPSRRHLSVIRVRRESLQLRRRNQFIQVRLQRDLDAAVLRAPLRGIVAGYRIELAVAARR